MCELFGKTKQAYYKRDDLKAAARDELIEKVIVDFARDTRKNDSGIGCKKIWIMYNSQYGGDIFIGRDRFIDILSANGLRLRRRIRKPRTTFSGHGLVTYPNLVYGFVATAVNQLWVSDITYVKIWIFPEKYVFAYLSLIMDGYSREIIGWTLGDTLDTAYTLKALEMAYKRLESLDDKGKAKVRGSLIHHSDRGVQYASKEYVESLRAHQILISMTESGNPKDNAMAERINSTIKNEMFKDLSFWSLSEAREAIRLAVDFYNEKRPHMSLDMMTPAQAAECTGEFKKRWFSYRDAALKNQAV